MAHGDFSTRTFAAGAVSFVVRCPSQHVCDLVEALFVDLGDRSANHADLAELAITQMPNGDLALQLADGRQLEPRRPNSMLTSLVTSLSRLALDGDPDRLHLHCAALVDAGRGVLMSAASGTGKTVLAAELLRRGWHYVSDEVVAFERHSTTGTSFAKPLTIKPGGGDLVDDIVTHRIDAAGDPMWSHVPGSAVATAIESTVEPDAVVILRRDELEPTAAATPLHPADAVVQLMNQTMDAERFGADAVVVLARVAAGARCLLVDVGALDATAAVIAEAVRADHEPLDVRELSTASADGALGWRADDAVRSVAIGERIVVHHTAGGAIVALDEAGAAVWLALHGDPPTWWDHEAMDAPGTVAFLEQLEEHNLVSRRIREGTGS